MKPPAQGSARASKVVGSAREMLRRESASAWRRPCGWLGEGACAVFQFPIFHLGRGYAPRLHEGETPALRWKRC